MMKKLMIGAAALTMVAAPMAASAQPFSHGGWNGGGRFGGYSGQFRGGNGGAVLAAGLFGLALGAAVNNADYQPAYAYGPGYGPVCVWRTQAVVGPYGYVHYQPVQVCR
jgi:hypothetical protein